jgi:hypothetical protein
LCQFPRRRRENARAQVPLELRRALCMLRNRLCTLRRPLCSPRKCLCRLRGSLCNAFRSLCTLRNTLCIPRQMGLQVAQGPSAIRADHFASRADPSAGCAGDFALRAGHFALCADDFASRAGPFAVCRNGRGVDRNAPDTRMLRNITTLPSGQSRRSARVNEKKAAPKKRVRK